MRHSAGMTRALLVAVTLLFALSSTSLPLVAHAHPGGAVRCDELPTGPRHSKKKSAANTDFQLTLRDAAGRVVTQYTPGNRYVLELANAKTAFKGFLVDSGNAGVLSKSGSGAVKSITGTKTIKKCVTHSASSTAIKSVKFGWTAPTATPPALVTIKATVVVAENAPWFQVSKQITLLSAPPSPTGDASESPPVTTTTGLSASPGTSVGDGSDQRQSDNEASESGCPAQEGCTILSLKWFTDVMCSKLNYVRDSEAVYHINQCESNAAVHPGVFRMQCARHQPKFLLSRWDQQSSDCSGQVDETRTFSPGCHVDNGAAERLGLDSNLRGPLYVQTECLTSTCVKPGHGFSKDFSPLFQRCYPCPDGTFRNSDVAQCVPHSTVALPCEPGMAYRAGTRTLDAACVAVSVPPQNVMPGPDPFVGHVATHAPETYRDKPRLSFLPTGGAGWMWAILSTEPEVEAKTVLKGSCGFNRELVPNEAVIDFEPPGCMSQSGKRTGKDARMYYVHMVFGKDKKTPNEAQVSSTEMDFTHLGLVVNGRSKGKRCPTPASTNAEYCSHLRSWAQCTDTPERSCCWKRNQLYEMKADDPPMCYYFNPEKYSCVDENGKKHPSSCQSSAAYARLPLGVGSILLIALSLAALVLTY